MKLLIFIGFWGLLLAALYFTIESAYDFATFILWAVFLVAVGVVWTVGLVTGRARKW